MKDEINEILDKDTGFIKKEDFKVVDASDDTVKLSYEIKKDGLNPYDIVHGGVLFGLADSASGILAAIHNKKCVTTSGNINFISPAKSGTIYAIAKALKEGNKIGYYLVEIYDDNNKLLATSNFNMYFLYK